MVNSSMGSLVQTRQTLEDNLYCAKVIFVFVTHIKEWQMPNMFLQYEKSYQISNGAFSNVFCVKLRSAKKSLFAAKVTFVQKFTLVVLIKFAIFVITAPGPSELHCRAGGRDFGCPSQVRSWVRYLVKSSVRYLVRYWVRSQVRSWQVLLKLLSMWFTAAHAVLKI